VETVFGDGISPGKLAVGHSLFLYALAKTQISLREILSKAGYRTYHYHQLHLLAQGLVSVVAVPLRVAYNLYLVCTSLVIFRVTFDFLTLPNPLFLELRNRLHC